MDHKRNKSILLKNTGKIIAFASVLSMLFVNGCTFAVPSGSEITKDDISNSHAVIIEDSDWN